MTYVRKGLPIGRPRTAFCPSRARGVLPTRALLLPTTDRKLPGLLPRPPRPSNAGVARSSLPIDRRLEGCRHDQGSARPHRRPGPGRRQVPLSGVPRGEARRGGRQRSRRQLRKGARRAVLPGRAGNPGGGRPGSQHRRPGGRASATRWRQPRRRSASPTRRSPSPGKTGGSRRPGRSRPRGTT